MNGSVKQNKQTGNWDFVFSIPKYPLTGKRKQVRRRGFKTKREATEEMVKLRVEYLSAGFIEPSTMKYVTYMEKWLKERTYSIQESTHEVHLSYYRNVIKPNLGHFKLRDIEPMNLQEFINHLVFEMEYSPNTVHLVFRIVKSSLKKACTLKLIKGDPTIGVTLPKIRKTEMNIWTLEQVNYFITQSKQIERLTRFYIVYVVALLTGMRQGEILALRWKDIDFKKRIIYIRQTITQNAQIKVGAKNNSSVRSIHIPELLIKELEGHRNKIREEKKYLKREYKDVDLVACTRKGNPVIARNCRREFYNLIEKLGLPKIRFHDLRHTHATMLIQQNVNVKLISERLGHTDIQTTLNTYSHVLPNMQREVADKLDEMFG
ncbi:tyrosine-type recombinase/integrase [Bacillus wiedmannii]|uniref:site-specific integrase n=1 Tax=Bacillus wiedmannii TaxID=1890302 RepID=UPI002FFED521